MKGAVRRSLLGQFKSSEQAIPGSTSALLTPPSAAGAPATNGVMLGI
jgi:hypothetical protein